MHACSGCRGVLPLQKKKQVLCIFPNKSSEVPGDWQYGLLKHKERKSNKKQQALEIFSHSERNFCFIRTQHPTNMNLT